MKKILIILLSIFFSSCAFALTLNEALEATYENNTVLKAKREELKKQDEQIMEALSKMLPSVTLSKTKRNGKQVPSEERQQDGYPTQTIDGITSRFILQQNLFRGGSDLSSLIAARNSIEYSRALLISNEQDVLRSAVESFLKLKGVEGKYENAKKMEHETAQYINATEHRFSVGDVTKTDVAVAKYTHADAKARKSKYWSEYISEQANFKNITGLDGKNLTLSDVEKDIKLPANMDETVAIALRNNPNITMSYKNRKIQEANVKGHLGTLLPSINLQHEIDNFNHAPVLSNERNLKYAQVTTIDLTIPIFDGGVRWAKVRSAKRAYKQSEYDVTNTYNNVTQGAISAWSGFHNAKDILKSRKEALDATKLAYEGAKEEEKAGIRASIDVIHAQKDYFANYDNYVDAKTQYYKSLYILKSVIGECTAQGLNLKVKLYDPLKNYNRIKWQLIGAY